jgi:serine/threonine protein kinase/tetratricopeptide (TPR) repeat protein
MTVPDRQIMSLLGEAVEYCSPEAQAAFLDRACAGDAGRRERVEALLRAYRAAGNFLESGPPASEPSTTHGEPIGERPGTVIGPYTLREQIGEGGMGLVFVAEQKQPVRRKVALKVIKPGLDSKLVIARFEAERQALALMDHPHIAKVFDGGTTQTGRPYFVMELVKGTPITDYCDTHRLTTRDRLTLFLDVCQAVQHAHRKGIIHRDLKPSNVLVEVHDVRPVVKVIDFGIAKAVGQQLTDHTLYTGVAQLVGTPLYMSPEQAGLSSLDVDTRSDVYALGVLLYELLTGTTPFDSEALKQAGYDEMRRIIREDKPPKPSARLSTMQEARLSTIAEQRGLEPRRLSQQVRGELDWIVMRALEKDRNRRYESANAFAADVPRYLNDEPVHACPPSAAYRFRKFVRRNTAVLTMLAVVALALFTGTGLSIWQAVRATTAQRTALEANELLASIFENLDPTTEEKDGQPLRVALGERLDRAAQGLERIATEDALAAARPQKTLGHAFRGLGYPKKAIPLYTQAHATYLARSGLEHPDTLESVRGLFWAYWEAHELDDHVRFFEEAFASAKGKFGTEHPVTLDYMDQLAWTYLYTGSDPRFGQAIDLFQETVRLRKTKLGPEHLDTIASMAGLAWAFLQGDQLSKGVSLFEETIPLQRAKLGPDHRDTLKSIHRLADGYEAMGRIDEAVACCEEVLKLHKAKRGPKHRSTLDAMTELAEQYLSARKPEQAVRLMEEALVLHKNSLGTDHPTTLGCMDNLGYAYAAVARFGEAIRVREEAVNLMNARLGPDDPQTLKATRNLARTYEDAGKSDQAIRLLEDTLEVVKPRLGSDAGWVSGIWIRLAEVHQLVGRPDKALPLLEEILKRMKHEQGLEHPNLFYPMQRLVAAYQDTGKQQQGLALIREAWQAAKAKLGPAHPETLRRVCYLARQYQEGGQPTEAIALLQGALEEAKDKLRPFHPQAVQCLCDLADAELRAGHQDEAVRLSRQALARERGRPPGKELGFSDDLSLAAILSRVGRTLLQAQQAAEAEALLRECLAIRSKWAPDDWTAYEARSLLGDALLAQQKYTEAEPLLLQGYEGMKHRKNDFLLSEDRHRLAEAIERIVRLYEATKQPEKARVWRAKAKPKLPDAAAAGRK